MAITFNNTTYPPGFFGTDDGGPSASFSIDTASTYSVSVSGTVNQPGDTVTLTYGSDAPAGVAGTSVQLTASQYDNPDMILFTSDAIPPGETEAGTYRYVVSNTQLYGRNPPAGQFRTRFTADDNTVGSYNAAAAPCFTTGTLIRTARGEVAVEDLVIGDLAVTASGAHRPIRWIGSRTMSPRRSRVVDEVMPVRIRAGALGENRPARDLVVSPGHAIALDVLGEVLIPASVLVNGATIVRDEVESVTYWHVELDGHDLLVAEGQPAESYLDMGNRGFFAGGAVVSLDAGPDAAARSHADFCRPFHDGGAVVEAVRAQARLRAEALGWTLSAGETWAGVHLEVDGRIVRPEGSGLTARFALPADAREVWLVSPVSVPSEVGQGADGRRLGLCLSGLSLSDGSGASRSVALDDALLCVGFHTMSPGHRWTAGRARLPAALLAGLEGEVSLTLDLALPALPRWVAPEAAEAMPLGVAA